MSRLAVLVAPLAGRLLLASLFLWSGYAKLALPAGAASRIAARGLPLPLAGAILAGLVELACGVAIAIGFATRTAALVLVAYVALVTWLFHFAPAIGGDPGQVVQVFKNAAIAGGLLFVVAHGPGPAALQRG